MQSDFTNVETELRDIENAFATGRMNAFGSTSTQDAFVHELKRIAEIETQVFYRTCALLKSSNTNEHTLVTNMYASAQPPPQTQRTSANGMSGGNLGENSMHTSSNALDSSFMFRNSMSAASPSLRGPYASVPPSAMGNGRSGGQSPGVSRPQSHHGRDSMVSASGMPFGVNNDSSLGNTASTAPHIRQSEWANEDGFTDKAFEDVAAHFDELESQFTSLGDYLREISKHVIRLNDMSEQVNSGTGGGGGGNNGVFATNSVSLNGNGGNSGGNASGSGGVGRRARSDSFDDDDGGRRYNGSP